MILYAYNRFCTKRFPLPNESQVQDLERRIEIALPDDYREFILEFNGGYFNEPVITPVVDKCPQDALTYLCGIGAPFWGAELGQPQGLAIFDDNDPPKIMPIGDTAMGGLIILDIAPGKERGAICLKQAWGEFYFLADGIEDFFELLREPTVI